MEANSKFSQPYQNIYIGGYFELELRRGSFYHSGNLKFYNSARSALISLLEHRKPERLWLPHFLCESVYNSIKNLPIQFSFYHLDDDFKISKKINLTSNDCIFYVDYFGLNSSGVADLLERHPRDQIILDFSQSFFSPYSKYNTMGAIYSPRKFFGVPDGGFLCTNLDFSINSLDVDTCSINRMSHLLKRIIFDPEEGFTDYQLAESSLAKSPVLKISSFTKKLLYSIDYESIKLQRLANFNHLLKTFGSQNISLLDSMDSVSPLCFPLIVKNKNLREILRSLNIFIPCYWRECKDSVSSSWFEQYILNLLPLPIDHRYSINDMNHMINTLEKFI